MIGCSVSRCRFEGNFSFDPDNIGFGPVKIQWNRGWVLHQIMGALEGYRRNPRRAYRDSAFDFIMSNIETYPKTKEN